MSAVSIAMISLGCAKNLVSSEQMLWQLRESGFVLQSACEGADVAVVNTCGFIESAKREAIEQILELAALKENGRLGRILVTGCLVERYRDEILTELPEVDGLVGCGSFHDIVSAVQAVTGGQMPCLLASPDDTPLDTPRLVSTPAYTAYLKVAEGCDNRCAYCVIPDLRGSFRSRPMESVLDEAAALVQSGVRELILIAQDTTRYGLDLYGERRLPALLEKLCRLDDLEWLRLHYLYPDEVDDRLIDVVAREEKIVKYLDIPIQHCNDRILRAMGRRGGRKELDALIEKLRARIPGLVLRTSLIVGLPGETEAEFEELCMFLRETRWERAGVFAYSPEEGTPAAVMPEQVDEQIKKDRVDIITTLQQDIMEAFCQSMVGKTISVLVEGYDRDAEVWFGRSWADSPEVDGRVFFTVRHRVRTGEFIRVRVTGVQDGDLLGRAYG